MPLRKIPKKESKLQSIELSDETADKPNDKPSDEPSMNREDARPTPQHPSKEVDVAVFGQQSPKPLTPNSAAPLPPVEQRL